MCLLQTQDTLLVLWHSFAIPKVMYILHSSPYFVSPQLNSFDGLLRSILSEVINICLDSGSIWAQASLPVRFGGIGIRSTVQLAPSAFLASAAGCAELVQEIFPSRLQNFRILVSLYPDGH